MNLWTSKIDSKCFEKNVVSVHVTLWNFMGHSVLLGELFHRTKLISVWLWVCIVLEATLDISVRLEMRQIGPITYWSCQSDGPMNLADTVLLSSRWPYYYLPPLFWQVYYHFVKLKHMVKGFKNYCISQMLQKLIKNLHLNISKITTYLSVQNYIFKYKSIKIYVDLARRL